MPSPSRRLFLRSTLVLASALRPALVWAGQSYLDTPIVKDTAGRWLVPTYVNGHGPYRFMVDTGASHCALATEVAVRLKLPPANAANVSVHSTNGRSNASAVEVQALEVGSLRLARLTMPLIGEPNLLGVIGANALIDKRLSVEVRAGRLVIDSSSNDDGAAVPVQQRFGGLLLANGKIDSLACKFIIDTGAQRSIGNLALARRLKLTIDSATTDPLIVRTPDAAVAATSVLPPLPIRIGADVVIDLSIACAQLPVFALWELAEEPAVLLGMDYFSQLSSFAVDYRRSTLAVRQERR
ncbi:retroviral-like aspartic protease family protein [Steroidobacter sp.]|uniref:retroviral-like aspartic protease family protein n=1 Tax=Steroidobacter sp. TaxID=1978227 RepID=UPI001A475886|nr:retroviral-like aspartic protease family protein [Steroidobacter sp.]MBL8267483.1 retroviral-like aspartic protease family protein [Steroidobacter sp.]